MFSPSKSLFQPKTSPWDTLDVDSLLKDFFYLKPELFKQGENGAIDQGEACAKKFSNQGQGVAPALRMKLAALATAIKEKAYKPKDPIACIDLLTLYSNHIDQQRFYNTNAKLELKEKEYLVLHYLQAAFVLSRTYDYDNLAKYSPRELSTHGQLLFYLGKARRYEGDSPQDRLPMQKDALRIAEYLETLHCEEKEDPHQYANRVTTYQLPVCYSLQQTQRYDEAADLVLPQTKNASAWHRLQAYVQLANIYVLKEQNLHTGIELAEAYARQAIVEGENPGCTHGLTFNARICLMNVLNVAGKIDEAQALATGIVEEMEQDPNCGAKDLHREAAEKILTLHPISGLTL